MKPHDIWQYSSFCSAITPELIGDDHSRFAAGTPYSLRRRCPDQPAGCLWFNRISTSGLPVTQDSSISRTLPHDTIA